MSERLMSAKQLSFFGNNKPWLERWKDEEIKSYTKENPELKKILEQIIEEINKLY